MQTKKSYESNCSIFSKEPGVDITVDKFKLFLPSESSYPDQNAPCEELILNGDAESHGMNPYPFYNYRSSERIRIVEEEGNKFFRLFDRYDHRSSIQYKMDTSCFTRGVTYTISSKVRYHLSRDFVGGSEPYYWFFSFKRASDGRFVDRYIVNCPAQSVDEGWVQCSGEFVIDDDLAETTEAYLRMGLDNDRDGGKYDLDFDDISISYSQGYVDEVVVNTDDISCWGNDVDVHVTSSIYYSWASEKPNGILTQVKNVVDNADGTSNLQLYDAVTLPVITQEDDIESAAEIALMSRNVEILGDNDEDNKGGYMQFLHTPHTAQIVQGVEFSNMGRREEFDRFVSMNEALFFFQSFHFCIKLLKTSTFL